MKQPRQRPVRLVADRFLDGELLPNATVRKDIIDLVRERARKAHRFVFDDDAAARVAGIIHDIPDLLVREHPFARPSFDVMWIEYPLPQFWDIVTGRQHDLGCDARIAYFIDHGTVYSIVAGTEADPDMPAALMPFAYELHTPFDIDDQLAVCDLCTTSRLQLAQFLWGETYKRLGEDEQKLLRNSHALRLLPLRLLPVPPLGDARRIYSIHFRSSSGELRNIIALLLMLNRPQVTRFEDVPAKRDWWRSKMKPYLSHTRVRIDTDPKPVLLKLGTPAGESVPRRRHEVRGHWRHSRRDRGTSNCIHDWQSNPRFEDDGLHWLCKACELERWWINDFLRGDATKGFVLKNEYDVGHHDADQP